MATGGLKKEDKGSRRRRTINQVQKAIEDNTRHWDSGHLAVSMEYE